LNDVNELYEIEKLSKEPCDRQAVLFSLDEPNESAQSDTANEHFPEDIFDVTLHDLRYMLGELKRVQSDESQLMTKQMRELEQDKKAMKYAQVAIRICFKDRRVLQGFFRPKELVSTLYKFVEQSIVHEENTVEDLDFHLYTSPPKKSAQLNECNLVRVSTVSRRLGLF